MDSRAAEGIRTFRGPRGTSVIRLHFRVWLPTLAAFVLMAVTASLGNWQWHRAAQKRALQAQLEAARRDVPVDIGAAGVDVAALAGRRVRVRGRFMPEFDVFIDNRTWKGIAGFHLLSPLRLENADAWVLVLRGWVASDPANRWQIPAVTVPDGVIELEGIAQQAIPRVLELGQAAEPGPGDRIWLNVDLAAYRRWSGLDVQLPIIRQTDPARADGMPVEDGLVRDWPQPGADVERHVAYAFQWYAMAALAGGLWIWFVPLARWRSKAVNGRKAPPTDASDPFPRVAANGPAEMETDAGRQRVERDQNP